MSSRLRLLNGEFGKCFIQYLLAFFVPVAALSALLLYNNATYVNRESEARVYSMFQQFQSSFDHMILRMENTALHMSNNTDWLDNSADVTKDEDILSSLGTYTESFPYNTTIIYYKRAGQNVFFDSQIVPYQQFETYCGSLALSLSGMYTKLNHVTTPLSLSVNPAHAKDVVYATSFMYPIPEMSRSPLGTVCFLLSDKLIRDILSNYMTAPEARVYILNASHETIYSMEQTDGSLLRKLLALGGGIHEFRLDDVDAVVIRSTSTQSSYTYLLTIPRDALYHDSRITMHIFTLLIVGMIVFSIGMAFIYAKNYILSLQNAEEEQLNLSLSIYNQSTIIKELILKKLLSGVYNNEDEIMYDLSCAGLKFLYRWFSVISICFGETDSEPDYDILSSQLDAVPGIYVTCHCIREPENSRIAILLNFEESGQLQIICQRYADVVRGFLPGTKLGCSGPHSSVTELGNAYVKAIVAVSEKLSPVDGIYMFKQEKQESEEFQYPYVEHALILESIKSGNIDAAVDTLNSVFTGLSSISSLLLQRCLCFDVINMLVKISNTLNVPLTRQRITELSCYRSFGELQAMAFEVTRNLGAKCRELNDQHLHDATRSIIRFIQRERNNHNLSLVMLSNEFGLSQTYISKLVKEATGQTFLVYITQLRMYHIKQQLAETNAPIKDIILQSGYLDVANFNRKFKKIEGISPGQYRSMKKGNYFPISPLE